MDLFLTGMFYLAILLKLHFYYQSRFGLVVNTLIVVAWIMLYGVVAGFTLWPAWLLVMIMSIAAWMFFQDWTTQYFSSRWLMLTVLVPVLLPYCAVGLTSRLAACGLCIPLLGAVLLNGLGSADLIFLIFSGWLIGSERLVLLLLTSSIMSLVMIAVSHLHYIPLISFLVFNMIWILTLTF